MGYLQDYNAKQQTTSTGSTGVGFLQQYNSRQKTTTKPTATPTVKPKKKKVKDLTVTLVKPKSKFEKVVDTAKERAQNLVNNLTKKPLSPVVETKPKALPKTVQIKPGQKKIQKTQLKELFPDQPTAQASADFKTELKPKIAKTSFNEMAGNVLSKVYKPVQYQLEEDLQGKKRKLTGGQIVGGAIEDAMNSMIPSLGTGAITTAKGTISLGRQLLQGVKTGTVLSALHAVIKTLKEEEITAKDMLTAFGIGTLIGVWEPAPMTVAKGELQMAKNTLREYGINNYKNAVELKSKANKVFMKLHPDKGGDTAKFIEFNEAFNKVTSAGIDSSWKLPDISAWLKSLWRNSNKSEKQKALLKTKADKQFVKAVKEVVKSKPEVKISVGEKTPQQAIGEVIKSGKQNTPEGKEIIKMASEAQKTGQNVMVEKPEVAKAPLDDVSVYHGTRYGNEFEVFDLEKSGTGVGHNAISQGKAIYLSDSKDAARYFSRKANESFALKNEKIAPLKRNEQAWESLYGKSAGSKENIKKVVLSSDARIKEVSHYPTESEVKKIMDSGKYDAIKFPEQGFDDSSAVPKEFGYLGKSKTIAVFNPKIIKTSPKAPLDDISALAKEARKYKSAEEFVKAQGKPLYHGTNTKWEGAFRQPSGKPGSEGIFVAPSSSNAQYYVRSQNGEIKDVYLKKDAKIWDYENPKDIKALQEQIIKNIPENPQRKTLKALQAEKDKIVGRAKHTVQGLTIQKSDLPRYNEIRALIDKMDSKTYEIDGSELAGKIENAWYTDISDALENKNIAKWFKENYDGWKQVDHTDYGQDISIGIFNADSLKTKSQLTDIWNKANTPPPAKTKVGESGGEVVTPKEKPVIKPKTVSVPREQLPVGEGKEKVSRLEARVKQTLDNLTPGQVEQLGLSKYKQLNNKETIRKASEFVANEPDKALNVLMGKENPPEGLPIDAIFVAMANNSTDNMELAIKLASLRATRYGQEIQILKELIPNSNVKLLSDIAKMKEQGVAERFNIKGISEVIRKRTEAVVNRTRRTLRKKLARTNWDAFINSIETC